MFIYEKLQVYQKALDYSVASARLSRNLGRGYYALADQLLRAATSIPLNIAEGNGKWHVKERVNHFRIARASAFECAAIMDLLERLGLISETEKIDAKSTLAEITKMLAALSSGAENRSENLRT